MNVAYAYRYNFASDVVSQSNGLGLRLATSGGGEPNPYFFQGRLLYPREIADQLLTLSQVVSSRFYLPGAFRLVDPVVTSNDRVLRFEGFSSCCGVYARADVDAGAFDAELHGRGTTNVDFNSAMRTALARIPQSDRVSLAVGAEQVALDSGAGQVVEKKVDLPVRWLTIRTAIESLSRCADRSAQRLADIPRRAAPLARPLAERVNRRLRALAVLGEEPRPDEFRQAKI